MSATSTYMTFLMHSDNGPQKDRTFIKSCEKQLIELKSIMARKESENSDAIAKADALINAIKDQKIKIEDNNQNSAPQWEKLVDITEFPDLGTDPEMLETTTLSDDMQTFIMGIHGNESLTFNTNYDLDKYKEIKKLELKDEWYAVWFGGSEQAGEIIPNGDLGKFYFQGQLSVRVTGGGVNEVRGMSISIAPSTVIRLDDSQDSTKTEAGN